MRVFIVYTIAVLVSETTAAADGIAILGTKLTDNGGNDGFADTNVTAACTAP